MPLTRPLLLAGTLIATQFSAAAQAVEHRDPPER